MEFADNKVCKALENAVGEIPIKRNPKSYKSIPMAWYALVSHVPDSAADDDEYTSRLTYYVGIVAKNLSQLSDYQSRINTEMLRQGFTRGNTIPLSDNSLDYCGYTTVYRILL